MSVWNAEDDDNQLDIRKVLRVADVADVAGVACSGFQVTMWEALLSQPPTWQKHNST